MATSVLIMRVVWNAGHAGSCAKTKGLLNGNTPAVHLGLVIAMDSVVYIPGKEGEILQIAVPDGKRINSN